MSRDGEDGRVAVVLFLSFFAAQAAVIALSPVPNHVATELGVSIATSGQLRTLLGLAAGITALAIPRAARHGVTLVPGLYTLGLKFQRRRGSHFIGGVGADAAWIARRIVDSSARQASNSSRSRRAATRSHVSKPSLNLA
jgi:hypothetical protein